MVAVVAAAATEGDAFVPNSLSHVAVRSSVPSETRIIIYDLTIITIHRNLYLDHAHFAKL